jgi:protein O-mannosyl-transferase
MKTKAKSKQQVQDMNSSKIIGNSNIKGVLLCFVITVVTFFVYSGSFDNDFVNWDDQVYVEEQPLVLNKEYSRLWKTPVSLNYHPITMTSLARQVPDDVKKLKPAPFIKLNVWLHIINSVLVFIFILMISRHEWLVAFFAAMIFALHPMHVESVVWISERKDVLYTLFLLISCILYWKYLDKFSLKWLLLAGLFFLLSVLSKAMAVIIPVIWLLLDIFKDRSLKEFKPWLEKIPFLAISIFLV